MSSILAYNYGHLQRALVGAQPGDDIVLMASDYPATQLVIVPPGVTLRARNPGVSMKSSDGVPDVLKKVPSWTKPASWFAPIPVIRADPACPNGDLVQLSHGSRIKNIIVRDLAKRFGNPIAIKAKNPNQTIHAEIIACEIDNPGTSVVGGLEGAISRAIMITSEPADPILGTLGGTNANIAVTITLTRVRTPGPGSGVFAINFASNSKIAVAINNCRIQGNLDASGGITKTTSLAGQPGTQNSHVTIVSSDSLYEPGTYAPGTTTIACQLSGGGQVPKPNVTPGIASGNTLVMNSDRDRIVGSWEFGVVATGSRKFFSIGEAVNQCSLTLIANDLTIEPSPARKADVRFSGCLAGHPDVPGGVPFSVGDGNTATITLINTTAGGTTDNRYADAMYVSGDPLSAANAGNGNTLTFTGKHKDFIASNSTLVPPPDNAFF